MSRIEASRPSALSEEIERRDALQQARVARIDRPGERLAAGEIESDADLRMKGAPDRELVGIGDGVVELAPRQAIEQLFGLGAADSRPRRGSDSVAQLLERRGVRAARDDFDMTLAVPASTVRGRESPWRKIRCSRTC